jgi:CHAT domain-containing protein/tetratricopeptide (TPR) repeat protein
VSRHVSIIRRLLAASVAALCLVGSVAAAPGSRIWPVDVRLMRFSPAADSAWRRSVNEGITFGDSLLRTARGTDRALEAAVHVWRGRKFADWFRLPDATADLDTAWALGSALRDTACLTRVLVARAHGHTVLNEHEAAYREFKKALPMARAAGLPGLEGFANRGLGFCEKMFGRYADSERHLQAAIRLIPPEQFENRHSRFLLAEVKGRTGRHDEARAMFLGLLDEARLRNDRWLEAAVFNDLGNLEYEGGDPAIADRYWAYAAGVFDSTGNERSALSSRINRAHALRELGHTNEARAMLDRLVQDAERLGEEEMVGILPEMAMLYHRIGRYSQAEALYRRARAEAKSDAEAEEYASIELAALLRETGRPKEAEALLDSLLVPERRVRLTKDNLIAAQSERSAALRVQGRAQEALAGARAAERHSRNDREQASFYWLDTAIELARCYRELGQPDSAVVVLRRAARGWERWRSQISDLEWRERSGAGLAALFSEYGLALLDSRRSVGRPQRVREAFDALQAFQARTLEERMHGLGLAGQGMRSRVSVDSLQRGVLRDGELLVDLVSTPDTTFAFLATRRSVDVRLLKGAKRLDPLFADWREATLASADGALVESGLRRLSQELLVPLADPIRASHRVIFTGGGSLALWPLGALTLPGETTPLFETHELVTAPSATLLATLRMRERAGQRAPGSLLALGRVTDAAGRKLAGAESELRSLGSEFAGAEVRMNRGEQDIPELTADLPRWNVLHFAAHAEAVAGSPWRSGFLLGRGNGDQAYLRASTIASMTLRARLAVLSGCQSAGSETLAGEGALGLASAFLCSGTASVVATLWPIDDRVAQRFMSEFYDALASGRTVAGAVSAAQRKLRSRSDTKGPRDWAAFVASGEATTQVRLTRRSLLGIGGP